MISVSVYKSLYFKVTAAIHPNEEIKPSVHLAFGYDEIGDLGYLDIEVERIDKLAMDLMSAMWRAKAEIDRRNALLPQPAPPPASEPVKEEIVF